MQLPPARSLRYGEHAQQVPHEDEQHLGAGAIRLEQPEFDVILRHRNLSSPL